MIRAYTENVRRMIYAVLRFRCDMMRVNPSIKGIMVAKRKLTLLKTHSASYLGTTKMINNTNKGNYTMSTFKSYLIEKKKKPEVKKKKPVIKKKTPELKKKTAKTPVPKHAPTVPVEVVSSEEIKEPTETLDELTKKATDKWKEIVKLRREIVKLEDKSKLTDSQKATHTELNKKEQAEFKAYNELLTKINEM